MTGDGMVEWHHRFNEYEFQQALGDCVGQGAWYTAVHEVTKMNMTE